MAGLSGGYGRPITMAANVSSKLTQTYEYDADPYFGASCRCVRIKSGENGNDQGALPKLPVTTDTTGPAPVLATNMVNDMAKNKLIVFPNPVKELLNLDAKDDKDYYYQIYNMAGQLVKKGKFNNKQTNISELSTGTYLIRINNSESVVKIIKQ